MHLEYPKLHVLVARCVVSYFGHFLKAVDRSRGGTDNYLDIRHCCGDNKRIAQELEDYTKAISPVLIGIRVILYYISSISKCCWCLLGICIGLLITLNHSLLRYLISLSQHSSPPSSRNNIRHYPPIVFHISGFQISGTFKHRTRIKIVSQACCQPLLS